MVSKIVHCSRTDRQISIAVSTKSNNWLYFVRSIWLVYRPARPTTSWLSTSVCSSILKVSRWNAIKLIYELLDINSCHAYARNIIDHLGEACWWTVHPASKQRSEGEKVRVGDDLILVSVATERYLVSNANEKQSHFYFSVLMIFLNPAVHTRHLCKMFANNQ